MINVDKLCFTVPESSIVCLPGLQDITGVRVVGLSYPSAMLGLTYGKGVIPQSFPGAANAPEDRKHLKITASGSANQIFVGLPSRPEAF